MLSRSAPTSTKGVSACASAARFQWAMGTWFSKE